MTNPFTALGLPARPDLTDEQVRAAWRAIAAATHPDRPDGGDPARYAAASAAYATLRTAWGRSEAYADLMSQAPPPARMLRRPPRRRAAAVTRAGARPRPSRPAVAPAGAGARGGAARRGRGPFRARGTRPQPGW